MLAPAKFLPLLLLAGLGAPAAAQTFEAQLGWPFGKDGDGLGFSAALSGDTAVFGAPDDRANQAFSGTAVVFVRSGGSWAEEALLVPSDGQNFDKFGSVVAIDGDTIVVGAPEDQTSGGGGVLVSDEQGSAYVFVRSGGNWSQQAKLTASDASPFDNFGTSVTIQGDTIVVGAGGGDGIVDDTGAAYVFTRSGSSWSQVAKLSAGDGSELDNYGSSVVLDGNTLLVGASFASINSLRDGAVYVYTGAGSTWTQQAKLTTTLVSARMGSSLDLEGDQALIGAVRATTVNGSESGAALVFTRSGSVWTEQAVLLASDGEANDGFGRGVALSGTKAVITAFRDDDAGSEAGAAWVFTGAGSGWDGGTKFIGPGIATFDGFGSSAAADGDLFVVGAPRADGAEPDSGLGFAYAFDDPFTAYCFCATGPCGNDDASAGCANSTGSGALLTASGSTSVASDDLVLTVSNVPASQFGIVYMGGGQASVPFGDGQRCVGAGPTSICRFPVQSTGAGTFAQGPGTVAFSQGLEVACRIDAGETWNFQGWFRDPAGPCGTGFNLSNGVSVTFTP